MKKQIIAFAITLLSTTAMASDMYPERPEVVDYPVSSDDYKENIYMEIQKMKEENGMFQQVTWIVAPGKDMPEEVVAYTEPLTKGRFNIYISDIVEPKYLSHIMWHEWGHVSYHRMPYKLQRAYGRLFKNEPACVSKYACTSAKENFAEWSVYFYHYNEFQGLVRRHGRIARKAFEHQSFFRLYQNYIFPITGANYGG